MQTTTTMNKGAGSSDLLELVSFNLGGEEYGVDILMVQEINRMIDITRVPKCPEFVEGVINLRGRIIPIINLSKRLGLPNKNKDKSTRIIVVNSHTKTLGMVVDSVSEVLRLPKDMIEPPPPIVAGTGSEYIHGVGRVKDKILMLLDLTKLLTQEEKEQLNRMAA